MSHRSYPHYAGREKYRGTKPKRCACCHRNATHVVSIQLSIFRGDDDTRYVCDDHAVMAKQDYNMFCDVGEAHQRYLDEEIEAQHEETGRKWSGARRALPPRYHEISG